MLKKIHLQNILTILVFSLLIVSCSSNHEKNWFDSVLPQNLNSIGSFAWVIIIMWFVGFVVDYVTGLHELISNVIVVILLIIFRDYGFLNIAICFVLQYALAFLIAKVFDFF